MAEAVALRTWAAIAALTLLGIHPARAQDPVRGGVLHMSLTANPVSASIQEESDAPAVNAFQPVFNNLVMFDQHVMRDTADTIVPDLATSWSLDPAGTTLTFALRDGVRWHDGVAFTSADVKCTWDAITGKRNAGWRKNPRRQWYSNLLDVTVDGPLSVSFHLAHPQPAFLSLLASGVSPVYPCHVDARDMRTKPIGTGPFKVASFKPNDSVRLVRNPDYWKPGRPYLDAIDWRVMTSRSTAMLAFVGRELDLFRGTLPLVASIVSQAPQARCDIKPTNAQGQLLLNTDGPPLNDVRVRQALALSIDRKAFVDTISNGKNLIAGALLPPPDGQWGLSASQLAELPGYGPDVAANRVRARELLAAAGFGAANPLRLKVTARTDSAHQDVAVLVVSQLRTIGIEGQLDLLEPSIWFNTLTRKGFTLAVNTYGVAVDDPDVVFFENYACGSPRNYTGYCNRELQAKMEQQSSLADPTARAALVHDIDRGLQMDVAKPVLFHSVAGVCQQPYLRGFTEPENSEYNNYRLEDAWLDK